MISTTTLLQTLRRSSPPPQNILGNIRTMAGLTPQVLTTLQQYTACDISDCLLKLKVAKAGHIADLTTYCNAPLTSVATNPRQVVIAPASTVQFIAKSDDGSRHAESNIPSGSHWVDLSTKGTILVESQPEGQTNAVLGGIMALRLRILGIKGIVVHGRIRDMDELEDQGLMIWAKGTSTVGTGADTKAHAVNVPITVSGVTVVPGDIVFCDPLAGVVVIPQDKLDAVVELLPKLTSMDDKVKKAVTEGMSVQEAFAKFRS